MGQVCYSHRTSFLVSGIASCSDPADDAKNDKPNNCDQNQRWDLVSKGTDHYCEGAGYSTPTSICQQEAAVGHVSQTSNVAHGVIREEWHYQCDDVEDHSLPGSTLIPTIQCNGSDPFFGKGASIAACQPESHLPAEYQAYPCDQDAAAEAVDVSTGDHQGLAGDECQEGLQDEQDEEYCWSPQPIASYGCGDGIQVTEPVQGFGQWLSIDPQYYQTEYCH